MQDDDPFEIEDFLPYALSQAAEAASQGFAMYYKAEYGMLRTEWRVLFHLGRFGEMTAREICDRSGLHKTKVSRAVAALDRKKYLARRTDVADRRHERLSVTTRGRSVYADLVDAARRFDAEMCTALTDAEREVLRSCLHRIARMRPIVPR